MPAAIDELTAKARTMDKLTLTLPLPPKELSPNASSPWNPKAKWFRIRARKDYRELIYVCACQSTPDRRTLLNTKVRMTETYRIAGKRKRDVRNLFAAFKAGEDGLVDAGIIPGDDDSVLEHGAPKIQRVSGKKDECVVVEIEEIPLLTYES